GCPLTFPDMALGAPYKPGARSMLWVKIGEQMLSQKISYTALIRSGGFLLILVLFGLAGMQVSASQSPDLIAEGKQIFRFDTFGDEDFWGGQLRLHDAIQGE